MSGAATTWTQWKVLHAWYTWSKQQTLMCWTVQKKEGNFVPRAFLPWCCIGVQMWGAKRIERTLGRFGILAFRNPYVQCPDRWHRSPKFVLWANVKWANGFCFIWCGNWGTSEKEWAYLLGLRIFGHLKRHRNFHAMRAWQKNQALFQGTKCHLVCQSLRWERVTDGCVCRAQQSSGGCALQSDAVCGVGKGVVHTREI